jgi:hypothetical protein
LLAETLRFCEPFTVLRRCHPGFASFDGHVVAFISNKGGSIVTRKLIVLVLLVVIAQATFVAHAGMHFPGTAKIDHSTFIGIAEVEGFGGNTAFSTVGAHLFTPSGGGLTAFCVNPGGNIAPGQKIVAIDISQTSPNLFPDTNGNASFTFTIPLLPTTDGAGCPNGNWSVGGLKGTLFVTYTAKEYKASSPGTLFALATLGFQCTIDEAVNPVTQCVQIFETAETF